MVLNFGINWFGNILFYGVYKGVYYVVSYLMWWQGVGINWIEYGKYWLNMGRMECLFVVCGFMGDYCVCVGF